MVKTRVAQLLVMTNEMSKPYISLFKGKYAANTYMNQYKRQYKQIFGPSTNQPIGNVDTMRKLLPFAISDAFNFSVLFFDSNIGSRASLICGLNMIKDKCGTDFMILGFLKATNEYFNVVRILTMRFYIDQRQVMSKTDKLQTMRHTIQVCLKNSTLRF